MSFFVMAKLGHLFVLLNWKYYTWRPRIAKPDIHKKVSSMFNGDISQDISTENIFHGYS